MAQSKRRKAKSRKAKAEQLRQIYLGQPLLLPPGGSGQQPQTTVTPQTNTEVRTLQAELPEISAGGLAAGEIQSGPKRFNVKQITTEPAEPGAPIVSDEQNPLAPALGISFDAVNFNENASLTGFFQIPPDPAGAAGSTHVVNVTNSVIEWYTKAGTRQNRQSLTSFFATAPTPPQTITFDPKVVYDHYANRFVVVTMERVEASGSTPNQSRVYLAVSDDSDPNGIWFFQTLTTEETINTRQCWADFPGLAFDSEAVYFTTNMFAHNNQTQAGVFQGQRLWIMAKTPWYAGGTPVATRYNPTGLANAVPGTEGAVATTMQPTLMYGDVPGGLGTYLLAYSGLSDGVNNYIQVIRVDDPLGTPTFTVRFSLWGTRAADDASNLGFPGAPQLGTTRTIATNDRRFSQHGVFRNGLIYCAAPIRPPVGPNTNQVTVRYFIIDPVVIDTAVADPPPTDQGNVGGEDIAPGTHTFFPSVAVDSAGNLAIGFAASAPTIYPGAYFTGRLAADPATTTRAAGGLRAGRDFYVRAFSSSMTVTSRWGDYSGIALDPTDGTTFWVFNEYALPRGTVLASVGAHEAGRWGNAWGSFSLATMGVTNAGQVIISEFRLRGPEGANDEFIELYNNTDAPITVNDVNPPASGPSGWAIVSGDNPTVAKAIVPTGTTIPARGHYLVANNTASTGYSLGSYPAGNNGAGAGPTPTPTPAVTTATPDLTYATDIPDNVGLALFRSANPLNYVLADRLDAVGSTNETNPLFKEGTGYQAFVGFVGTEHSLYRSFCPSNISTLGTSVGCTAGSGGRPKDSDANENDFVFVDTFGNCPYGPGACITPQTRQRLGAPGPENLSSPIVRNTTLPGVLLDAFAGADSSPNRVRDLTSDSGNNSTFGTIEFRRRVVNNTGAPVTRLRFRIIDLTTFNTSAGVADLRARTSSLVVVSGINDAATCFASTGSSSTPCSVTVQGTTLETPPIQLGGGGFNSSLSADTVTLPAPLAAGASINIRFLLGVQGTGFFRFYVNVEALP